MKKKKGVIAILSLALALTACGQGNSGFETPTVMMQEHEDGITQICEVTEEDRGYEIGDVTLTVSTDNDFEKSFELKFGEERTSFNVTCYAYRLYKVISEGREYLYIGTKDDFGSFGLTVVPIYDKSAAKPYYMENGYGLYTEDDHAMSGIGDIRLTKVSQDFGSVLLIRHYHIEEGIPVRDDEFAYCVTGLDSRQQDSSKACGDRIIASKDMEAEIADSIDLGEFSKETISAGTGLTYYKISDNNEIYFVTDEGQVVRFTATDHGVLDGVYTISDFDGVPIWG